MKLRKKFAFLIASIIIIPILLTMITSFIILLALMQDKEVQQDNEIMQWMVRILHKTRKVDDVYTIMNEKPEGIDVIILDMHNNVLVSSIPEILPGIIYPPEELLSMISLRYPERSQTYDPFFISGDDGAKLLLCVSQNTQRMLKPFQIFRWLYVLFLILLIAGTVIGIIFLGSFRTSIIKLEHATNRIADGDLDFVLTSRGKDELASLTRSFDSMRSKLKEEYAKRSRFLMAISHDLSTPLTSIKGYMEAINDGLAENTKDFKHYMSIISDRVDMLETRIDELIEFVRMETGEWQLRQQTVNVKDFMLCTASMYKEDATLFKRTFGYTIDIPDTINILIDQNLCLRALENLFHNAIRYTREEDEITFTVVQSNNEIHLIIHDTGDGIAREELDHIFDPFFRGNKFNNRKGFGMGLSIVKSIITAHGWDMSVASEPGQGTSFIIVIREYDVAG
ncbi:MAG: HAMP domain-containing histidine kinase [Spirochaetales bacterium]|nr:HAMP domain-containing histidine kinase [Spirochaetales bacterium]